MANLIIIGNGFDMAHGMKTDYTSFLRAIIQKCLLSRKSIDNLIDYNSIPINLRRVEVKQDLKEYKGAINSPFLKRVLVNQNEPNWCDLEDAYFDYVLNVIIGDAKCNTLIDNFHSEFAAIIKELESYLKDQEDTKIEPIESYKYLFHKKLKDNFLIVNFNYTNTLGLYKPNPNNVIHIHGELNNKDNPIIFGYAANDDDCRKLFRQNNNEFIRHIKKYNYSLTDNYQRILRFFENNSDSEIDILIFGHSCSMSDKLILNQIFNHNKNSQIREIRFFYYEDPLNPKESYFQNHINLARVLNGNLDLNKLVSFSKSHRMPQGSDSFDQNEEFKTYVDNNLKGLSDDFEINISEVDMN